MHKLIITLVLFIIFYGLPVQAADKVVNVGGYEFPPFVSNEKGRYTGLSIDLIEAMNQFQNKYRFQFTPTSSVRRYKDFAASKFDMVLFESIKWGWQDHRISSSMVFLKGGEIYVTKADEVKDQTYFDRLEGKSILGFVGYHYGFANFNADRNVLKKKHTAKMTTTHTGNILSVIKGRADIAVVTMSFLSKYLLENPQKRQEILISKKLDQEYNHTILIRKNAVPSVAEINQLLIAMGKKGFLDILWKKYGIDSHIEY